MTNFNYNKRVQRVRKAINPVGNSKADWKILQEIANKIINKLSLNINNQLIVQLNGNTCVAHVGDYYKKEVLDIIQAQKN